MKTIQLYSLVIFITAIPFIAKSQTDSLAYKVPNEVAKSYFFQESFWLNSINSSKFYQSGIKNYSRVEINYGYENGDYKKVYDPNKNSIIGFNTTGIKSSKKFHFLGTFDYNHQISKNIDWSLMMDAERANPFMIADSIGGDWLKDRYTLGLKVCSEPFWNFLRFGINTKYSVAIGGRDNDPRPKSTVKKIHIAPSVSFSLGGKNSIGISYIYTDYMEDIDVMIKSGVGAAEFYKIMGLALKENPLIKSSYEYRIEAFENGVSLSYETVLGHATFMTEGSYILSTEKDLYAPYASVTDPATNEVRINSTIDARFSEKQYDLSLGIDFKDLRTPQKIILGFSNDDGSLYNYGTSQVEYNRTKTTASVRYIALLNASNIYKATSIAIGTSYTNEEANQAFYANRNMESLTAFTKVNHAFKIFGQEFCGEIDLRVKFNLKSNFTINPESVFIEPETDITNPVIWSAYYFDSAEWISPNIGMTYYPTLAKKFKTYLGLYWSGVILTSNDYYMDGTRNFAQVKFGFLF